MNGRLLTVLVLALAAAAAGASAQTPAGGPATLPAQGGDLSLFTNWLAGEFDNFQQVSEQKENKVATPHSRAHVAVTPVTAPALGAHVFLAKQSSRDDLDRVGNVHLYVVSASGDTIALRLYGFEDTKAVVAGLNGLAGAGKPLPLDQARPMPGCDVTWQRQGDAFVGSMATGACRLPWPATGESVTITNTNRLTSEGWSLTEKAVTDSGVVVLSQPGDVPFDLRRARLFNCWAALRKEGTPDKFDGMLNVVMHDQGKWVDFKREDGTPTPYSFELSQLRYGQKVPVMKLAVYEAGKEQSIAYTWGETAGRKIGINMRWIQVGCSIKE